MIKATRPSPISAKSHHRVRHHIGAAATQITPGLRCRRMLPSGVTILLALGALWWPARMAGVFDGAPFDSGPDAVVLGLILPLLFWLTPGLTRDRSAQVIVVALLAWKMFLSAAVTQDGLCARVLVPDQPVAIKNWDVRTDWRSDDPQCSAIVDRALTDERQFPIWLPFSFVGTPPSQSHAGTVATMTLSGYVRVEEAGTLRLLTSPSVEPRLILDGRAADTQGASVAAGSHRVEIAATLRREDWMLTPTWNDTDLFTAATITASPPSALDRVVRPWGKWISTSLVTLLLAIALSHAYRFVGDRHLLLWIAASALSGAAIPLLVPEQRWHFALTLLFAVCAMRIPARLQSIRGAFAVLGPAWLALNVIVTYRNHGFGRVDSIVPGNDWWVFQRCAYLIYMNGFWLQGGEDVFWYQPFYRWMAGALHLLFGQSHVGESYWDAIGVSIFALFSFEVVRIARGMKWGLAAAALVLVAFVSGPGYIFIGRGLSEISSAALICLAAIVVIHARERQSWRLLVLGSCVALVGAWTRLNNLPMAVGIAMFAWPLREPAAALWKPRAWLEKTWLPPLIVVPAVIAFGMFLFALRTWHYTGHFSVFYGTQSALLAVWQPGMSAGAAARAMLDSVLMVATTTDPPSYHNGAVPIMAGSALALASLSGVGALGRLPLPLVGFTLAAFSSALIARGNAYSGRFSIHVVAVTVAILICAIAEAAQLAQRSRR